MDEVDRVADLRDDVDRVAQQFGRVTETVKGPFTGQDHSGSVTVTATDTGQLKDVRVSVSWRSDLEPVALGAAVVEAYTAAGMSRLEGWGNALAEDLGSPPPSIRPLPQLSSTISARLAEVVRTSTSPEETQAILDAIAAFLREVNESIDAASEDVAALQRTEVSGRSESGHVEVVLTGAGDLREVRYDEGWLERAHVVNIGRETVTAQQNALRAMAGRGVTEVLAASRLGQLQALANDPVAFARRLRMGR